MFRPAALLPVVALLSQAAVRQVEILERAPVGHGYQRIRGRVRFAVNAKSPANRIIRDLSFAERDGHDEVEFSSDLYLLAPEDPAKSNGTILFEVSNRGGRGMLNRFALADNGDEAGDG